MSSCLSTLTCAVLAVGMILPPPSFATPAQTRVVVFPVDGSATAHPETTVSVRGLPSNGATLEVMGSRSGAHTGVVRNHRAGTGFTFDPTRAFSPGETVTVRVTAFGVDDTSEFVVSRPAPYAPLPQEVTTGRTVSAASAPPYVTRPDLRNPTVTVSVPASTPRDDVLFATPRAESGTDAGLMAFDEEGELVWFQPAPPDVTVGDLKVAQYFGQDVLTWFEGTALGGGYYRGSWVVVDESYGFVTRIHAGNGMQADLHDIELTDHGTALLVIYNPVFQDLTSIGGQAQALVFEAVVQEVDLLTGDVLFEWHSLDEIPVSNSQVSTTGGVIDYIHINSIDETASGDLLASMRNTSEVVFIDRETASLEWQLGGIASDFAFSDEGIRFTHDARELSPGVLSIYDNGNGKTPQRSRGVIYSLDIGAGLATRQTEYRDVPTDTFTATQGATEILDDGDAFVAWGGSGRATQFSAPGTKVFEVSLDQGGSYRVQRAPWHAVPSEPPAVAIQLTAGSATVYVSWNGATDVATWRVLGGTSPGSMSVLATKSRDGFETAITVNDEATFVAVEALDSSGTRLTRTEAVRFGPWYEERTARQVSGTYTPVVGDFVAGLEDDVLWYGRGSVAESIWPSGPGGFGATIASPQVVGGYEPLVVDLVGDERDEILWWTPGQTTAHLWRWQSGTVASAAVSVPATPQAFVLDNRVGKDEVLFYAPGSGADFVVRVTWIGASPVVTPRAIPVGATYTPLTGDFDSDGWADVLWYAPGTAPDYIWYLTGAAATGSATHVSVPLTINGGYRPVAGRLDPSGDAASDVLWIAAGADFLWRGVGRSFVSTESPVPDSGTSVLVRGSRDHILRWIPQGTSQVVYPVDPGEDVLPTGNTEQPSTAVPVVGDFTKKGQGSIFWYRPGSATEVLYVPPGG